MRRPIIPISLSFIIGVVTFILFPYFTLSTIIFLFLFSLLLTYICFSTSKFIFIYLSVFFTTGMLFGYISSASYSRFEKYPDNINISVVGVVKEITLTRSKNTKIYLQTEGEKLLVFLKGRNNIELNDIVSFRGVLKSPYMYQNPGVFSWANYLKRQGIYKVMFASSYKKIGKAKINFFSKLVYKTRDKMIKSFETLPSPYSELLGGIVLGTSVLSLPYDVEEIFRKTGTVHILVASGAQVGLLIAFCFYIFYFNKITNAFLRIFVSLAIFSVTFFYGMLAGANFPILRATIMGGVLILSIILEREYDPVSSLFLSAFLIVLIFPLAIFDVGFILSFSVCFGIIYLSPKILNKLKNYKVKNFQNFYYMFAGLVSITLSAQIMVLPLTAYWFHRISLISIFANLITLPFVGILLPLGLISSIAGFISVKISYVINLFCGGLLHILLFVSEKLSKISFAYIDVFPPTVFEMIIYYSLVIGIANYKYILEKLKPYYSKIMISILFLFLSFTIFKIFQTNHLKITFIDVGQGDSILIQTPQGRNILIDVGGTPAGNFDIGENIILPLLRYYRIKEIDILVLTHPHLDHTEGAYTVIEKYKPKILVSTKCMRDEKILELIDKKKIKNINLYAQDKINLQNDLSLIILNPTQKHSECTVRNIDEEGIVIKLNYKNTCFLFCADIPYTVEERIIDTFDVRCKFLKVAHHGSRTSTSEKFLEKVNPQYCIISAGKNNPWGHPHKEVIERLEKYKCKILRTDADGAVIIKTDGEESEITLWGKKEKIR